MHSSIPRLAVGNVFLALSFAAVFLFSFSLAHGAGNLVANGDFETAGSSGVPQGWLTDTWGSMTVAFTYPVAGDSSASAARVDITKYSSGDAKWYFNPIAVTAGTVYQLSDNYMSNVPTEVDVDFKMSDGSDSYYWVADVPSSGGAWGSVSGQITAPSGAVSMTVLHLIQKVGYLEIDNMSVTSGTTPPPPTKPVISSFAANPTNVVQGNSSTLSWSVTGATLLSIDQGVGVVTGTSKNVAPTATTTYTLSAGNSAGTTTATVVVDVTIPVAPPPPPPPPPAPTCAISANPQQITQGNSSLLSWTSQNATAASLDNGITLVATSSSKNVSPIATTTYTLTVYNGGTATSTCNTQVGVTVSAPPPPPPPPANLIANGNFESGSKTPTGWTGDYWGNLKAAFAYPVAGYNGSGKAAKVTVTNYKSGDAKWYFGDVPVSSNTQYLYTDNYTSNVVTNISIEFVMSDGSYDYEWLGNAPASSGWATFTGQLTVPTGAVQASILHVVQSNGTLTIDNASLTPITAPTFAQGMVTLSFDDGTLTQYKNAWPILKTAGYNGTFYIITNEPTSGDSNQMTWVQIHNLANQGNDIGGHTETHPYLTTLTAAKQQQELTGSYNALVAQGFSPKTLAYPYGDENPQVENYTKAAGYSGARGSYYGINGPYTNRYDLYDMRLDPTVSLAKAESWIDQAVADKRWVVFEIHDVETGSGDGYQITPAFLQSIVNYLKSKNVAVVTAAQGMQLMNQ